MIALQPHLAGCLQQDIGAIDIRLDKGVRVHDRPVDVALGRKVDDRVDLVLLERRAHDGRVADVASHKAVAPAKILCHVL